jgi:hypothetical protein
MSAKMPEPKILHAWFSPKQKEHIYMGMTNNFNVRKPHTNIYLTIDGTEVEVTEVNHHSADDEDVTKRLPDAKYLGVITKWLRAHYD